MTETGSSVQETVALPAVGLDHPSAARRSRTKG
jgi:hypothetical protein